jgi:hypothetical protein
MCSVHKKIAVNDVLNKTKIYVICSIHNVQRQDVLVWKY